MDVICKFDPWQAGLCSCPEKYSLNPYTGCDHQCIYCYATYIPRFYQSRRKKNLLERIKKDLRKIPENSIISISNSSDPYLNLDRKYQDTRKILELLQDYNFRILIITKSDLILRDIDLLKNLRVAVTFSVTSLKKDIYQRLEPNAPSPEARLKTIETLNNNQIDVGLRLDPIFIYLTDGEISEIVRKAKESGVKHVVSSTFKPRKDSWLRFKENFPRISKQLEPLYFRKGERINNSWYLPKDLRERLMLEVKKECQKYDISFASCREGFPELQGDKSCDGSHLI